MTIVNNSIRQYQKSTSKTEEYNIANIPEQNVAELTDVREAQLYPNQSKVNGKKKSVMLLTNDIGHYMLVTNEIVASCLTIAVNYLIIM